MELSENKPLSEVEGLLDKFVDEQKAVGVAVEVEHIEHFEHTFHKTHGVILYYYPHEIAKEEPSVPLEPPYVPPEPPYGQPPSQPPYVPPAPLGGFSPAEPGDPRTKSQIKADAKAAAARVVADKAEEDAAESQ